MKKKSLLLLIPLAAAAVALGSCGKEPGPQCDQASVILDSQAITIEINETKQLTASSNIEGCNIEVNWHSEDDSVASVDQNGVVTGHKNGSTMVYANDVPCLVTVGTGKADVAVESIVLDTPALSSITMVVGDTQEVIVNVLPDNATDKLVNFKSTKESVVIINESGEIEAVGDGTAKVIISSNSNPEVTAEINITVEKKVLTAPEKTVDGLSLVHNENLNDGDYVYFTAIKEMTSYVMMAYESGDNIKSAENTVVGDKLGVNTQGYLYYVIKNADNTYSFVDYTNGRDNPRYLQAGSSKLTAVEKFADKCKFNVSIVDGKANIVCADPSVTTNTMAYNSGKGLFNCYEPDNVSKQKPIQIYRADSSHEIPVTGVEIEAEKYEVPVDGELKVGAHVLPRFATDQEIQYSLTNVEPVDSITLEGNVLKSSGVGSGTLVARSNSGNVEASVPVTSYEVTPIVANGVYTISETRNGVTYYMTNNENKAGATTDENLAVAVDFIKVEHKINTYRIKVSDGTTYMHVESNNLTFVEGVENASEFIISEGTKEVGAYDIAYSASDGIRHITLEDADPIDEFKANKSGIKENTDLTPSVVKHITGITVDTKPNKLEYFVNQVLDTTGMVVSVHFDNETEKVITNYDVSKAPFTEAGEAVSVEVEYQGFKDTFTVKVKERTLLSIAIDGDMTNKNYQRTEPFDPTGLRVIGTYEDQDDLEVVDSGLYTLSYDPEKANTIGDNQTVTVTATMNEGSVEPAVKTITGVNVSKLHVTEVKINGNATQIIEVGQMLSLTASVKPTDADEPLVVFSAEEGKESVLSVSQDGIVTATGVGKAKVTATSLEEGVDNPVSGSITVEVVEALPNNTTDGFRKLLKLQDVTEGASVKFFVSTTGGAVYGMGSNDAEEAKHQPGVECLVESEQIAPAAEVAEFQIVSNDDSTYSFLKDGKYLSAAGGGTNGLKLVSKTLVDDVEVIPANARFNILFENGRAVIKCANEKTSAGIISFYNPTGLPNSFSCVKADSAQSYAKVAMYIKDLPIESVNIVQDSLTLDLIEDTEGYLNYEITPSSVMPESVEWSLKNNTGAVSIDQTGKVTALQNGSDIAVVTVNGEFTDECPITVNYGPTVVTGVSLDNEELSIVEGAQATLVATVAPEEATNKNVSWTSTNETVATVDNGVITAKAPGDTIITVTTADQGKTATCSVTVTAAKVATLVAANDFVGTYANNEYERFATDGSGLAFNCYQAGNTGPAEGKQIQIKRDVGMIWNTSPVNNIFKLSFTAAEGAKLPSVYAGNSMKPTEGTLIEAVVDAETGMVTYDFGGSYSYFVLVGHKDGASIIGDLNIKYASINEYSIAVSGLELNANTLDLTPTSDPEQLEATIAPVSASDKTVTWSIKEGSDDCITLADGLVTPKATGTATVVCTSNDNPSAFAECVVTVSTTEKKIDVNEVDVYELTKDSLGLTSSYADSKAGADITFAQLGWYSSSIQGSKDKGSSITNAYAFSRAIKYIKFNVAVDKPSSKATLYFGSEAAPSEGGINLGNGTDYGFVAGKSIVIKAPADSTYFKLAYTNAAINFSSIEIGFKDYVAPAVESVSLDSTLAINVGGDVELIPVLSPSEAEGKEIAWSSDNTDVATVVDGVVHGVSAGTANVKVVIDGKEATCAVTVSAVDPYGPRSVAAVDLTKTLSDSNVKTANYSAKTGYYQDSGTKDSSICTLTYKSETALWEEMPESITFNAVIGGGSAKDPITYPIEVVLLDATGNEISGTKVTITQKVTTAGGDAYAITIPNVETAYGFKVTHMKEDGWNARYYSYDLVIKPASAE